MERNKIISLLSYYLLFLALECNEILHRPVDAQSLYEQVLTLEPHNALAHAGLGLLLLGTGESNFIEMNCRKLNNIVLGNFIMLFLRTFDIEALC